MVLYEFTDKNNLLLYEQIFPIMVSNLASIFSPKTQIKKISPITV